MVGTSPASHRRPVVRVASLVTALVAVVVITAACGGGVDAPTEEPVEGRETLGLERWTAMTEQRCATTDRDFSDLSAAQPATAEEATEHAEQVQAYATRLRDWVSGHPLPDARTDTAQELLDEFVVLADASDALLDATQQSAADEVDTAAADILRAGERINELATELDIPACGGY